MKLEGKMSIVTGGATGLGKAMALEFANAGADVVVCSRNKGNIEKVRDEIMALGRRSLAIVTDVCVKEQVVNMVKKVVDEFGRIDILVNNAAVNLPYRAVVDLSLDEWNRVVTTNLTGPFLCCRAVAPVMIAQRHGKIINMSSIGGRKGEAGRTPYRSTKAALINFTECFAAEVKEHGIDVNAICPGAVDTDMLREITNGNVPSYAMPPEDIASVVVLLASDESKAFTGTNIDAFGTGNPLFRTTSLAERSK